LLQSLGMLLVAKLSCVMACYQNAQLGKPITFFTTQISSFFQNHISIVFIEGSS